MSRWATPFAPMESPFGGSLPLHLRFTPLTRSPRCTRLSALSHVRGPQEDRRKSRTARRSEPVEVVPSARLRNANRVPVGNSSGSPRSEAYDKRRLALDTYIRPEGVEPWDTIFRQCVGQQFSKAEFSLYRRRVGNRPKSMRLAHFNMRHTCTTTSVGDYFAPGPPPAIYQEGCPDFCRSTARR
jgi:hypothetical protein